MSMSKVGVVQLWYFDCAMYSCGRGVAHRCRPGRDHDQLVPEGAVELEDLEGKDRYSSLSAALFSSCTSGIDHN